MLGRKSYNTLMLGILRPIRARREARRLSQREVASLSGTQQSNYSKIELGKVDPRVSTLVDIARALDFELMLVPREIVSVVQSLSDNTVQRNERPLFEATGDE